MRVPDDTVSGRVRLRLPIPNPEPNPNVRVSDGTVRTESVQVCAHLLEQLEAPLLCSTVPLGYAIPNPNPIPNPSGTPSLTLTLSLTPRVRHP